MADNEAKAVVLKVCELFEQNRAMEAAERYFSPDYIEHNQEIPNGNLEGFKQVLRRERMDRPGQRDVKISVLRVIAEGDDVGVHMKCEEPGKPPLMIMELYRVKDGLVVEHWDAMQALPAESAHERSSA
jgi:predicted SnoaL-like aldol condensation-catalyzing enzyme